MLKTFIVFLSFSSIAMSATPKSTLPSLKCISALPTTSFLLTEGEKSIQLRVINHNGAQFAPVYSGIVTPNDMDHVKKSGEFFNKIGDDFVINFEKNNCRLEEDKFFTCFINDESVISETKIHNIYFTTSESTDRIPNYEFTRTNVRLSIREKKEDILDYRLEMSYYFDECLIEK